VQARLVVVDEDRCGDVHGVDQDQAFLDPAFPQAFLHGGGDVNEAPAGGDIEPELFTVGFHGPAFPPTSCRFCFFYVLCRLDRLGWLLSMPIFISLSSVNVSLSFLLNRPAGSAEMIITADSNGPVCRFVGSKLVHFNEYYGTFKRMHSSAPE
jgi:hypothetical protein